MTTIPDVREVFRGREDEKLRDIMITREEVLMDIDKLKVNKAAGPDDMYPRVLKECKNTGRESLIDIFNRSVVTGEVPRL